MRFRIAHSLPALILSGLLGFTAAQAATVEPPAALASAATLLQAGQLTQADHAIAQALAAEPDSAKAHYLDARLLAAEGKWPLAEQELERARRLDPTLSFGPAPQVQALANEVLQHRWKNPSGLVGYGEAALAGLFVLISGYLIYGVLRGQRPRKQA